MSGGRFTARVFAADTNGTSRAELNLEAADAQTPWATITNLQLQMQLASSETQTNLIHGEFDLSATEAHTEWAGGSNLTFSASWVHAVTNPIPISGEGRLKCDAARSRWGSGRNLDLSGILSLPDPATLPECGPSWAWWTNLHPYALAWRCTAEQSGSPELSASNIACAGTWLAPRLSITNLVAELYAGQLDAGADLDVATRRLRAHLRSDFDPKRVVHLLGEKAPAPGLTSLLGRARLGPKHA